VTTTDIYGTLRILVQGLGGDSPQRQLGQWVCHCCGRRARDLEDFPHSRTCARRQADEALELLVLAERRAEALEGGEA